MWNHECGIHHVPLHQLAFELDRLGDVELGGERVMRARHRARAEKRDADNRGDESRSSSHDVPYFEPGAFCAAFFSSSRAPARMFATP